MDPIHGRIIMLGGFRSETYPYKPRRRRITYALREGNPSSSGRRGVLLDDSADRITHGGNPTSGNKKGMHNQDQGKTIHHDQQGLVQKVIPRALVAIRASGEIISDNKKQFRDNPFKDRCEKLHIKQRFASVKHPQSNDQVERANHSLGEGIKARLDILEEIREKAAIREARSKAKIEKYYNVKVRSTSFRPGDFVYRSNEASHAKKSGKLGPKWEGPYEVMKALGKGVYKLRNSSEDILLCTWNIQDLKKCYL
nr:reverse transcriptase domain-containing protein [Tanacetum cinerariifolium]